MNQANRATVITMPEYNDNVYITTGDEDLLYCLQDFYNEYPQYCYPEHCDDESRECYCIRTAATLLTDSLIELMDRMLYFL